MPEYEEQAARIWTIMDNIMSSMTDFTDGQHALPELAFQGAEEMDIAAVGMPEMTEALDTWRGRDDPHASGAELFRWEHCPAFSITYEGDAGEYWPDETQNDIVETLVREFLYRDGICCIEDESVRLVHMKYNIMALAGDEYVLVCPYLTEAGNISGILVVCVTKILR